MLTLETREDVQPVCSHCETELHTLWTRELRGLLGKRYVYFCPQCRKVLGLSHRTGFWMG